MTPKSRKLLIHVRSQLKRMENIIDFILKLETHHQSEIYLWLSSVLVVNSLVDLNLNCTV